MIQSAKKIGVILNGCGHRDGSEIQEAVLTLLALEQSNVAWQCLALNRAQVQVINHATGRKEPSISRNMLEESARIARGNIRDISTVRLDDFSAIIIPGGTGTAFNLCDFANSGAKMSIVPEIAEFLIQANAQGLPIGAICIAPILLAKLFGARGARLTLGGLENDASKIASDFGARVEVAAADQYIVDQTLKLVTTPAYMLDASMADIATGIRGLVAAVLKLRSP